MPRHGEELSPRPGSPQRLRVRPASAAVEPAAPSDRCASPGPRRRPQSALPGTVERHELETPVRRGVSHGACAEEDRAAVNERAPSPQGAREERIAKSLQRLARSGSPSGQQRAEEARPAEAEQEVVHHITIGAVGERGPQCRKKRAAGPALWEHVDALQSNSRLQERRVTSRLMARKIQEFDRRWSEASRGAAAEPAPGEKPTSPARRRSLADLMSERFRSEAPARSHDGRAEAGMLAVASEGGRHSPWKFNLAPPDAARRAVERRLLSPQPSEEAPEDGDDDELSTLEFVVGRCSSQDPSCTPCVLGETGRWQSAPRRVRNEFVAFDLHAPATVHAIEFVVDHISAVPKRCRVQYALQSQSGPFRDAWQFSVTSPQVSKAFRTSHTYGSTARAFAEALLAHAGSEKEALRLLTDGGKYSLSQEDFIAAMRRLQRRASSSGSAPARNTRTSTLVARVLAFDLRWVFRERDAKGEGVVAAESFYALEVPEPRTRWWRLLMVDNWGCVTHTSIGAPCRLLTSALSEEEDDMVVYLSTGTRINTGNFSDIFGEVHERMASTSSQLTVPLHTVPLETKQDQRMERALSEAFSLSAVELAELRDEFKHFDEDGSGDISKSEFIGLLERILKADLASHRDFLWEEATRGKATVSFEDFLEFHSEARKRLAGDTAGGVLKSDPHWDAFKAAIAMSSSAPQAGEPTSTRRKFFRTLRNNMRARRSAAGRRRQWRLQWRRRARAAS